MPYEEEDACMSQELLCIINQHKKWRLNAFQIFVSN
jgi:hypothetical protein